MSVKNNGLANKVTQDFMIGLAIIFIAVSCLMEVSDISPNSARFPKLIIMLLLVSGIGITISSIILLVKRSLKKKHEENSQEVENDENFNDVYLTKKTLVIQFLIPGVILLVVSLLLRVIGFYIASFIIAYTFLLFQEYATQGVIPKTKKYYVTLLLYSVGSSVVMWIIFNLLLNIPTPRGFLGF